MSSKVNNKYGNIIIDNNVIATIAGLSAMECYGLVGMASKNPTDGIVELLRREYLTKGVKVTTVNNNLVIDLYIIVQFGTNISAVANNIIDKVKYNVENLSGMIVDRVNVNVQGVRVQK